ncbi:MAG: DNA/RNA non-specific endonuclease [Bacteroidota bacterium]
MKKIKHLVAILLMGTIVVSCSKKIDEPMPSSYSQPSQADPAQSVNAIVSGFPETFESGTKTAYAGAAVSLTSGSWYLNNALIGTSASDAKNGSKSVRITSTGTVSMQFNITNGASSVSVKHAAFGSDGSSTWELWMSTNSGSSYTKVGSTVTTSGTSLQTATFSMNVTGNVRFEIRKLTGTSYRINIDDFTINDNAGGGGGNGADGDHMAMGNPSGATNSISNENNYLMQKVQYTLSYNRSKATPNWVSWYLGPNWLGSAARQDDFRSDATLPSGWYKVGASSYSGSGFDRGHNCPSADRTSSMAVRW